jgi:hypothetical protein
MIENWSQALNGKHRELGRGFEHMRFINLQKIIQFLKIIKVIFKLTLVSRSEWIKEERNHGNMAFMGFRGYLIKEARGN